MKTADKYQERYLAHQERKKQIFETPGEDLPIKAFSNFTEIVLARRSVRKFQDKGLNQVVLKNILYDIVEAPASCNRQAVRIRVVETPEEKDKLNSLLVGGKGWIGKADKILLFFADMEAYKSPNEVAFMPYLDAGVMAMTACYSATGLGAGSCIVNPNVRQGDQNEFNNIFNPLGYKFCLAVGLGYPAIYPPRPEKLTPEELLYPSL